MQVVTRKPGSQRASRPRKLVIEPNWVGEGGYASLIFRTEDDKYLVITPETPEDVKVLMSQAHVIHHNFKDTRS